MADEARRDGVDAIAAVGTAGLRVAANGAEFVDAVEARCGVQIEVIPGEEEGRLAYLAAKSGLGLGRGSLVVFDTGGGSSQFTFGRGDEVDERFSVHVGAARLTERYGLDGAVSEEALAAALDAIAAELERLDGRPTPDALVGMGGAVTNLAAVKHGLAHVRPGRRPGHRARPRRDRPADRALPHAHGRRAARRSSACSRSAPRSSSRAPASSARC